MTGRQRVEPSFNAKEDAFRNHPLARRPPQRPAACAASCVTRRMSFHPHRIGNHDSHDYAERIRERLPRR